MRRRITDAWARLGALTPAAGLAAMRRSGGAAPPSDRYGVAEQPYPDRYGDGAEQRYPDRYGDAAEQPYPDRYNDAAEQPYPDRYGDAAEQPSSEGDDAAAKPSSNRNKVLVAGAGVLAVVAVGGVVIAPRLLGPSDPGCKAYAGNAVTAYNKTIHDLNAQASQSVLAADMPTAITDLSSAVAQAQSASVKSALNGLLTQLQTVQADVKAGTVPATAVSALNAASSAADKAC